MKGGSLIPGLKPLEKENKRKNEKENKRKNEKEKEEQQQVHDHDELTDENADGRLACSEPSFMEVSALGDDLSAMGDSFGSSTLDVDHPTHSLSPIPAQCLGASFNAEAFFSDSDDVDLPGHEGSILMDMSDLEATSPIPTRQLDSPSPGSSHRTSSRPSRREPLPNNVTDIDLGDENDPRWLTVYVNDIIPNMLYSERQHQKQLRDYMNTVQTQVTSTMREILVDWLVVVMEEYGLSSETLHLAVNYIDRFLSARCVERSKLQLVGLTCLFVASKFEENLPPTVQEFIYIAADTYTRHDVLAMEIVILNNLEFELAAATTKMFCRRFVKAAGANSTLAYLTFYLSELTLQNYKMTMKYLPSLIAASSVSLSLITLNKQPWSPTLSHFTYQDHHRPHFQDCLRDLHEIHKKASTNEQRAVYKKYSEKRFKCVATFPPSGCDLS